MKMEHRYVRRKGPEGKVDKIVVVKRRLRSTPENNGIPMGGDIPKCTSYSETKTRRDINYARTQSWKTTSF
jgi:hypothetical protein